MAIAIDAEIANARQVLTGSLLGWTAAKTASFRAVPPGPCDGCCDPVDLWCDPAMRFMLVMRLCMAGHLALRSTVFGCVCDAHRAQRRD
jgi:hypothetical protein